MGGVLCRGTISCLRVWPVFVPQSVCARYHPTEPLRSPAGSPAPIRRRRARSSAGLLNRVDLLVGDGHGLLSSPLGIEFAYEASVSTVFQSRVNTFRTRPEPSPSKVASATAPSRPTRGGRSGSQHGRCRAHRTAAQGRRPCCSAPGSLPYSVHLMSRMRHNEAASSAGAKDLKGGPCPFHRTTLLPVAFTKTHR